MARYGLAIDLDRCVGCYSCAMGCKAENYTSSGVWWNNVVAHEESDFPAVRLTFTPRACMHCDNPPCAAVCPTGATHKRDDGIVVIDKEKCIGCRRCMAACPYQARTFLESYDSYYPDYGPSRYEQFGAQFHRVNTAEKCHLCAHLVDMGQEPACVQSCPAYARTFGDLDDPNSTISQKIAGRKAQQILVEQGTKPKVYYLS